MSQAAKRCFEKAQELERSFQTPEGSNAALCWFNAEGGKKRDHSCWYCVQASPATETAISSPFTLTVLHLN